MPSNFTDSHALSKDCEAAGHPRPAGTLLETGSAAGLAAKDGGPLSKQSKTHTSVDALVIDAQIRLYAELGDGSGVHAPQYGRGRLW